MKTVRRGRKQVTRNNDEKLYQDALRLSQLESEAGPECDVREMPTVYPTPEEYADPIRYMESIWELGEEYGAVKVVPPAGWKKKTYIDEEKLSFKVRIQNISELSTMRAFAFPEESWSLYDMRAVDSEFRKKVGDELADDPKAMEKFFWSAVRAQKEPLFAVYGADIPSVDVGSGFPLISPPTTSTVFAGIPPETEEDFELAKHPFCLTNLPKAAGSLLSSGSRGVGGVTSPWLYIGGPLSCFCWHMEDNYLASANFQHWGGSKIWYVCPGGKSSLVEETLGLQLSAVGKDQVHNAINSLKVMMSPSTLNAAGAMVCRAEQKPGELILLWPKAFHAGINTGLNCNEACNLAPPSWIPAGEMARIDYFGKRAETVPLVPLIASEVTRRAVVIKMKNKLLTMDKTELMSKNELTEREFKDITENIEDSLTVSRRQFILNTLANQTKKILMIALSEREAWLERGGAIVEARIAPIRLRKLHEFTNSSSLTSNLSNEKSSKLDAKKSGNAKNGRLIQAMVASELEPLNGCLENLTWPQLGSIQDQNGMTNVKVKVDDNDEYMSDEECIFGQPKVSGEALAVAQEYQESFNANKRILVNKNNEQQPIMIRLSYPERVTSFNPLAEMNSSHNTPGLKQVAGATPSIFPKDFDEIPIWSRASSLLLPAADCSQCYSSTSLSVVCCMHAESEFVCVACANYHTCSRSGGSPCSRSRLLVRARLCELIEWCRVVGAQVSSEVISRCLRVDFCTYKSTTINQPPNAFDAPGSLKDSLSRDYAKKNNIKLHVPTPIPYNPVTHQPPHHPPVGQVSNPVHDAKLSYVYSTLSDLYFNWVNLTANHRFLFEAIVKPSYVLSPQDMMAAENQRIALRTKCEHEIAAFAANKDSIIASLPPGSIRALEEVLRTEAAEKGYLLFPPAFLMRYGPLGVPSSQLLPPRQQVFYLPKPANSMLFWESPSPTTSPIDFFNYTGGFKSFADDGPIVKAGEVERISWRHIVDGMETEVKKFIALGFADASKIDVGKKKVKKTSKYKTNGDSDDDEDYGFAQKMLDALLETQTVQPYVILREIEALVGHICEALGGSGSGLVRIVSQDGSAISVSECEHQAPVKRTRIEAEEEDENSSQLERSIVGGASKKSKQEQNNNNLPSYHATLLKYKDQLATAAKAMEAHVSLLEASNPKEKTAKPKGPVTWLEGMKALHKSALHQTKLVDLRTKRTNSVIAHAVAGSGNAVRVRGMNLIVAADKPIYKLKKGSLAYQIALSAGVIREE